MYVSQAIQHLRRVEPQIFGFGYPTVRFIRFAIQLAVNNTYLLLLRTRKFNQFKINFSVNLIEIYLIK